MACQGDLHPAGPGHRPQRRLAGRRDDQHEVPGPQAFHRDLAAGRGDHRARGEADHGIGRVEVQYPEHRVADAGIAGEGRGAAVERERPCVVRGVVAVPAVEEEGVSTPAPRSIVSLPSPMDQRTKSSSSPVSILSLPAWPSTVSRPAVAMMVSSPMPPRTKSSPRPPSRLSLPLPPSMVSSPAPPSTVFAPSSPVRLSLPLPPISASKPVMVVARGVPAGVAGGIAEVDRHAGGVAGIGEPVDAVAAPRSRSAPAPPSMVSLPPTPSDRVVAVAAGQQVVAAVRD